MNIKKATISNNNLIFKISDYEAIILNDRQLNKKNLKNFSIKLNDQDKNEIIKNIFNNELIGKHSVYNNNVNTQLNLVTIEDGKINLNTIFSTLYDYNISDTKITLY